MDDKDDELTLRDKLAIAALPALIQRFTKRGKSAWIDNHKPTENFREDANEIAQLAYRLADAMRAARLQSFYVREYS